jgi:hypothetical protein
MKLPNFVLCLVIVIFGSIALKNFTNANLDSFKPVKSELDLSFDLSDSDLDKINGIVDEKLNPIREDLRTVEKSLGDRIDELQQKIADCSTRCDAMKTAAVAPVVKSSGSDGDKVANKYESKPAVVKSSSGGSSGAVVQNVYSQPVVKTVVQSVPVASVPVQSSSHWTYPGDITSHLQTTHGQNVSGMSTEQQLSLHDSIHESQRGNVSRTVTRSNVQTSNCPGGVCPTNSNSNSVMKSFARPRLFRR